jgi:hypothetical protein
MSQRSCARLAADPAMALWPLPHAVVLRIFAFVPVHTRLRGREVCRAWRAALAERSLWTRLDLRLACVGVVGMRDRSKAYCGLLRAALARAPGELVALDAADNEFIPAADVIYAAAANAGALRELRYGATLDQSQVAAVLHAAPLLQVLEVAAKCTDAVLAHQWLSNEAPLFVPLRLRKLELLVPAVSEAGVLVLAAGLAAHTSLQELSLSCIDLSSAAALGAVVDAVVMRQIRSLSLVLCKLGPASAPALATLLGAGALKELALFNPRAELFDASLAEALGAALHANDTLTGLYVNIPDLWRVPASGDALIGGLVGHRSLQTLYLQTFATDASQVAAGTALGAVVAANSSVLRTLIMNDTAMHDEGLRPICEALRSNTYLLSMSLGRCSPSAAFVLGTVVPAVRARPSLNIT